MDKKPFRFNDNVFLKTVKKGKFAQNDFINITFREYDPIWKDVVRINRYMLPGRFDTYSFDFSPSNSQGVGDHLRFYSEYGHTTITEALKMIESDFNNESVVKMLVAAIKIPGHLRYSRILVNEILRNIAKKTKSYRSCKRALEKREEEWKKEVNERLQKRKKDFLESLASGGREVIIYKDIITPNGTIKKGTSVKSIGLSESKKYVYVKSRNRQGRINVEDIEPKYISRDKVGKDV